MTDRGWTAIARSMWTDRDFPSERFCERAAWGYLISRARYDDARDLKRGQLIVSASELASVWLWSPREVSLCIQRFKRRGWLTVERKGPRLAILTLAAFDKYHPPETPKGARWSRDGDETDARQTRDEHTQQSQTLREGHEMVTRQTRDGDGTVARHLKRTKTKTTNKDHLKRPPSTTLSSSDGVSLVDVDDDVLAVPAAVVVEMGRDEDGNTFARFAASGPGKPVTRALRSAGFVFVDGEWVAKYSRARAALLGRIHPEQSKVRHRSSEDSTDAPATISAEAPRPATAGEVAAFYQELDQAGWLDNAQSLLRVVSLTTVDGSTCLELETSEQQLAMSINAFDAGKHRRRHELAQLWEAATGDAVWVAPIKLTADVVELSAERERRGMA